MSVGQASLLCPETPFFAQEQARTLGVGTEKHRQPQAQVCQQLLLKAGQFFQANLGKLPALAGLLLLDLAQHAFDEVAGELQVDCHFDDFGPAAVVLVAEVFAGHLCQVQLDRAVQGLGIFAQGPDLLRQGGVRAAQCAEHGFEQAVDDIAQAQDFAGGIGQRQGWRGQCRRIEVARADLPVAVLAFGQQGVAQPAHGFDRGQHEQAAQCVVEQVEADDQFLRAEAQGVHPRYQRMQHGDDQHQADQLVQQAAQGDAAPSGVLHAGADEGQQTAADVGADHQADGHWQADHFGPGKGRGEQHGRQAGVGNHREQRTDQGVEQDVAGQRGKQHLHPLRMGDGGSGLDDQLQRQDDQAKADRHPPQLADAGLFA
ncbi:hypothetical protein D3C81_1021000 [compost metagenome]